MIAKGSPEGQSQAQNHYVGSEQNTLKTLLNIGRFAKRGTQACRPLATGFFYDLVR